MNPTKAAGERTRTARPWISGPRFHPLIHATLKARAAFTRLTIETELHAILCAALNRADLVDEKPPTKQELAQL